MLQKYMQLVISGILNHLADFPPMTPHQLTMKSQLHQPHPSETVEGNYPCKMASAMWEVGQDYKVIKPFYSLLGLEMKG